MSVDLRLFINQSESDPARALVQSFTSSVPATAPIVLRGSEPTVELHFLLANPDPATRAARPFIYDDPAAWDDVTLAIGEIDAAPDAGTFTITDPAGVQTTAAIAYNAAAAAVQSAIRAALTTNYSAAVVTGTAPYWSIDRGANGAIAVVTGTGTGLSPAGSVVLIETTQTGDASHHQRCDVTLLQPNAGARSGASGDGWDALASAVVTPSVQTAGSATVNKTFRLVWNADAFGGSVFVSFTGDTVTQVVGPIAHNASAAAVVTAFEGHTDVEDAGVAVIKNGAGDYFITCTGVGILHSNTPALATSSNTLQVPVGLSGGLRLNPAAIAALLGSETSADTTLEVEKTIAGVPSTPLQLANARLRKDLIRHSDSSPAAVSTRLSARTAISNAATYVDVTFSTPFAAAPYLAGTPCVEKASIGDDDLFCTGVGPISTTGFRAFLSAAAPNANYHLHSFAFAP